jgi:AcrR family transcriptional regulator
MTAREGGDERPDTRTRILDTADRLFRHYGYDKTTVADLARELGMSPANVYRFFASKLAIVEAIAVRMFEKRQQDYLAIVAGSGRPSERLRRLLVDDHRDTMETLVNDRKVHDIVEVAISQQWHSIEQHFAKFADAIEALIREGIACGEFHVVDTRRAAVCARQSFVSMIHPTLIVQCGDDQERAEAEELADFIIHALRCP